MANHRWKENACTKCGIIRKREAIKTLMAITNSPPYDHYKYESRWVYSLNNKITTKRPECKNTNNNGN